MFPAILPEGVVHPLLNITFAFLINHMVFSHDDVLLPFQPFTAVTNHVISTPARWN